jgi:hypothetical protein
MGWVVPAAREVGVGGQDGAVVPDNPAPTRRRIRGKRKEGCLQLLHLLVVSFKERFPPGVLVETRNGLPVPEGTVRFSRNARLYSDGSAKHAGTSFATASCSVVERAPGQPERAVQVALLADWPRSAVAAEMYAILVSGYILATGDEDGCPHVPGSVTLVADCEAVCKAGLWSPHQQVSEKSSQAGLLAPFTK